MSGNPCASYAIAFKVPPDIALNRLRNLSEDELEEIFDKAEGFRDPGFAYNELTEGRILVGFEEYFQPRAEVPLLVVPSHVCDPEEGLAQDFGISSQSAEEVMSVVVEDPVSSAEEAYVKVIDLAAGSSTPGVFPSWAFVGASPLFAALPGDKPDDLVVHCVVADTGPVPIRSWDDSHGRDPNDSFPVFPVYGDTGWAYASFAGGTVFFLSNVPGIAAGAALDFTRRGRIRASSAVTPALLHEGGRWLLPVGSDNMTVKLAANDRRERGVDVPDSWGERLRGFLRIVYDGWSERPPAGNDDLEIRVAALRAKGVAGADWDPADGALKTIDNG